MSCDPPSPRLVEDSPAGWLILAREYRAREDYGGAIFIALEVAKLVEPDDSLFYPIKAEVATAGYYCEDPVLRELGHQACEELVLARDCHPAARHIAFQNLFYYTKKLSYYVPSFHAERVRIAAPDGYYPMNPSICRLRDRMFMNVRCVNYFSDLDEEIILPTDEPLRTRNVLVEVNSDLSCEVISEVLPPSDLPRLNQKQPLGVEDVRLFPLYGDVWFSGTVVQANAEETAEIMVGRIPSTMTMSQWHIFKTPRHEKNWAPIIDTYYPSLKFIYSYDPLRQHHREGLLSSYGLLPPIAAHTWSGSTQAIPFSTDHEPGWLVMIHEKTYQPEMKFTRRHYQQRFIWYDRGWNLRRMSRRFEFDNGETEFPCGMCLHPDRERLVISYGVLDREAWIATVAIDEVLHFMKEIPT